MEDNIFKFEDFLSGKKEKLKSIKQILESVEELDTDIDYNNTDTDFTELDSEEEHEYSSSEEVTDFAPDEIDSEGEYIEDDIKDEFEQEVGEEDNYVEEMPVIKEEEPQNFYNLYSDKSENFVCDIAIQGADPKQTEARLVVESGDWTLMFYGEVKGGKCIIPIKKLNILKEGQVGDIRLEVIAEGNIFVPWEDKFKVRVSKKVTVKVNEQKDYYSRPARKNLGVKVKVKR